MSNTEDLIKSIKVDPNCKLTYSFKEVAAYLNWTKNTARKRIKEKFPEMYTPGERKLYFSNNEVQRILQAYL